VRTVVVSRISHVPYHQNVYDLLRFDPEESPDAVRMMQEYELVYGPLPAAVWEWYCVPNVVLLSSGAWSYQQQEGTLWHEFSERELATPLDDVLGEFAEVVQQRRDPYVCLLGSQEGDYRWYLEVDDTDDPPVWIGGENYTTDPWKRIAEQFSEFVWTWLSRAYLADHTPLSGDWDDRARSEDELDEDSEWEEGPRAHRPRFVKQYKNGLWLRTPAEPFQPPVIDFLTDRFGEPERTPRPGNVTTYTFRPPDGTIRITADEPALTGGLSAWWVHATAPRRLREFAQLLVPWGTLRQTLHADTAPARRVWRSVRP
jgi:hypothetical protein